MRGETKMIKRKLATIAGLILFSCLLGYAANPYLKHFGFDDEHALDKWSKMIFNGQVDYRLMKYGPEGFIRALSYKNCSAIYYKIGFDSKNYPMVTWKWKVLRFPDKTKAVTEKDRDDYAARLYIIYPFLNFSTSKFIEYVWDEKLPLGTVKDSPVAKNIKQIVIRSGAAEGGQWMTEERNIYEDYEKAFGKKPNLKVGAIAIMCDADNTKTEASSLFDDIFITDGAGSKRRAEKL
jgi:hypothetical protein